MTEHPRKHSLNPKQLSVRCALSWLLSLTIATSSAVALGLFVLQYLLPHMPAIVAGATFGAVLTPLIQRIITRSIVPGLAEFSLVSKMILLASALVSAITLVARAPAGFYQDNIINFRFANPHYQRLAVQPEDLQIVLANSRNPLSSGSRVDITYITTQYGDISFQSLAYQGAWTLTGSNLFTAGDGPAAISWQGYPGAHISILFQASPDAGVVEILWDGTSTRVDLYAQTPRERMIVLDVRTQPLPRVVAILQASLAILAAFTLLVFFLWLVSGQAVSRLGKVVVPIFFAAYLVVGAWLYDDYGISTDELVQRRHGLVSAKHVITLVDPQFESSLLTDLPSLQSYQSRTYGVAMTLPLAIIEIFTNFSDTRDLWLFRHYLTFLFYFCGTAAFFKLAMEKFHDWWLALLGVAIFILTPRLFAESFYNIKDTAFLAAFNITLLFALRFWRNPTARAALTFALAAAFAANIRIVMLLLFGIIILGWLLSHRAQLRQAWQPLLVLLAAFGFFMVAFMPAAWQHPIRLIYESLFTFADYAGWDGEIMYMGRMISGQDPSFGYIPVWIAITTPLPYLALIVAGVGAALWQPIQAARARRPLARTEDLLLLSLVVLPVLAAVVMNSTLYGTWRHFYFIYSPLLLLGLSGARALWQALEPALAPARRKSAPFLLAAVIALSLLLPTRWMIANHPFEYVYFNPLVVELFGGRDAFERDHWRMSVRQGIERILAADPRQQVRVYVQSSNIPQGLILPPAQRARLVQVADPAQNPDYFINTFRYPLRSYAYEQYRQVFAIRVDRLEILAVYARP